MRAIGNSGLLVSVVGLGTNNFGMRNDVEAGPIVDKSIDVGINMFDTAASYGSGRSEQALGRALGNRRKDVIIATKWGSHGHPRLPNEKQFLGGSRDYIMKAVESSLRNLGTDYIDLYLFHYPDVHTPIEETLRALDDVIRHGKVRYIGASNMSAWRVVEAHWTAKQVGAHRFIACEDEYSLIKRTVVEPDMRDVAARYGLGLLPYFPLGGGLLTGKYRREQAYPEGSRFSTMKKMEEFFAKDRNWDLASQLQAFAQERGHTLLELAFSWLAAQPGVASIAAGATRADQVAQNAAAVTWTLSPEELTAIDRITRPAA
jgi:aryl-alcohol dehydrogenase-like predicted oxidoreductase